MAEIKSVRYVFIDIVGFTKNRHVDAQTMIIGSLNTVVLEAIKTMGLSDPKDTCIKIPTGDGMCIAITDPAKPSDIHVKLALKVLELIEHNNEQQKDPMYRFTVRIAVNENDDFLVKDINGKKNVAGRGINFARRILDKADAGHILAGSITYEKLFQREDYWEQFRPFMGKTKHGEHFYVYQYIAENHPGLLTDHPIVSKKGKDRLKAEQPEIWKEFSLDEPADAPGSIAKLLLQHSTAQTKAPEKTTE